MSQEFAIRYQLIVTKQAIVRVQAKDIGHAIELVEEKGEDDGLMLEELNREHRTCTAVEHPLYVCSKCGSTGVEQAAWAHINTGELVGFDTEAEIWCGECNQHFKGCCMIDSDNDCVFHNQPHAKCMEDNGGAVQEG